MNPNPKTRRPISTLILATAVAVSMSGPLWAGGERESFSTNPSRFEEGSRVPVELLVRGGEHFRHKLQILPLVKVNNPPQMAAWCETADGEFLGTLFVTERIATRSWRSAPADSTPTEEISRPEALPVWSRRSGAAVAAAVPAAGARVPEEKTPDDAAPTAAGRAPDAVTAATPKTDFRVTTGLPASDEEIVVYFEVNSSADFNETYPVDAAKGTESYSGGKWGSGQPALVYRARLAPGALRRDGPQPVILELTGRSSADGSNGEINSDLSGVTTAREIVEEVRISFDTSEKRACHRR